jgi:hypothetical protein
MANKQVTSAGKVDWAETVLTRAADTGLSLDAEGNLVETT